MELEESYRLLLADVYELAGASRATSEAVAREEALTVARWHVLSVLADGPRSVAAVARRLGLARQSVQRVVDALRREGLVTTRVDPADRRAPLVAASAAGREALDRVVARSSADRGPRLRDAGLTAAELDQARDVVRRLTDALAVERE